MSVVVVVAWATLCLMPHRWHHRVQLAVLCALVGAAVAVVMAKEIP